MTQAQYGESESCIVAPRSSIYETEFGKLKKKEENETEKIEDLGYKNLDEGSS
jgi:hypothetical protein